MKKLIGKLPEKELNLIRTYCAKVRNNGNNISSVDSNSLGGREDSYEPDKVRSASSVIPRMRSRVRLVLGVYSPVYGSKEGGQVNDI